jgi:hypothetical protein
MELDLQLCQLNMQHLIWSLGYRSCTGLHIDVELNGTLRRHSQQILEENIQKLLNHMNIIQPPPNHMI